ncbi:MAG: DUF1638 domain-containing protein [Candidatus Limivicinus sp.]
MSIGILACESLLEYVQAAQEKLGTNYPVFVLDYSGNENPGQMRGRIAAITMLLPVEMDTVLVAMGFCGGVWNQLTLDRRFVIPRVDDCVSLLLNTGNVYRPNPKQAGHLYLMEQHPEREGKRLCQNCPRWKADDCYFKWFAYYSHLDIVDTGVFDCYRQGYVEKAEQLAQEMNCTLDYVPGSNLLLEKLIGGQWDDQFLVAEPGQEIAHKDFFS